MSFLENLNNKWTKGIVTVANALGGFQSLGSQFGGGGTTAEDLAKELEQLNEKNKIVQVVDGGSFGRRMHPIESNIAASSQKDTSLPDSMQYLTPAALAQIQQIKAAGMNAGMTASAFDLATKALEFQQDQRPADKERDDNLALLEKSPATMQNTFKNMGAVQGEDGKEYMSIKFIPDGVKTQVGAALSGDTKLANGSAHSVNNTGIANGQSQSKGRA